MLVGIVIVYILKYILKNIKVGATLTPVVCRLAALFLRAVCGSAPRQATTKHALLLYSYAAREEGCSPLCGRVLSPRLLAGVAAPPSSLS